MTPEQLSYFRATRPEKWASSPARRPIPEHLKPFPYTVAVAQAAWEREALVARGRNAGLTYTEIGEFLGVSRGRVRQIMIKWQLRRPSSPLEKWMRKSGDLAALAKLIARPAHPETGNPRSR